MNDESIKSKFLPIQGNLVFFYYKDLGEAEKFYSELLGLKKVLDYGFAKIFHISRSTFIGLVDETKGMHKASEPKTVTLSFVTKEIDAWYQYLKSKGVKMRGAIKNASRHPTRGFVAYDPEGYFLEFERFLDHQQNTKLLTSLAPIESLYPISETVTTRPKELGIQANIIWLYYRDVRTAQQFYQDNFGFKLLVNQGFAKVYSSSTSGFIGLVDESQGLHRFSEKKAVNVSFITERVDEWYAHLNKKLKIKIPLKNLEENRVRGFVTTDTAGYIIEFDKFLKHQKNIQILEALKHL
jgi:predicted enzyme related to lactoylglutathione lyase